jgi:hypothetical protein
MTDKTDKELEFLQAYQEYSASSARMAVAGKNFTQTMKDSKPVLVATAWAKGREDELDNFNAEKAEAAALALHKMSKVYQEMADALRVQSQTLSKTADLAHVLIEEAKERANG